MDKRIAGGLVILILLFGYGIYYLDSAKKTTKQPDTATQTDTQQPETNQTTKVLPTLGSVFPTIPPEMIPKAQDAVAVTSTGFDPQIITVKVSTQVIWTNKSGAAATIASADHPTHQLYPQLNLGEFADGQILTLVFGTPGTYKHHDHLHPEKTGTVIVE